MENNIKPPYRIYLDDVRTPTGDNWIVVRNYDEFVSDAAKFLVALFHNTNEGRFNMSRSERKADKFVFPIVYVHSANPIGSANIMGYLNNFYMNEGQAQTCVRVQIPHV
jgi:hypothetical protein